MQSIDDYVWRVMPVFKGHLQHLVAIPSVSSDPNHYDDLIRVVDALAELAKSFHFTTHRVNAIGPNGQRYPVLAGKLEVGQDKPWLVVYNHADVQPDEPGWETNPFHPVITDEMIIGRGATDDKGPLLATLFAINYLRETNQLPVNVAFIFETAEEVGSLGFESVLDRLIPREGGGFLHPPSSIFVSDTTFEGDHPTIVYSLRGLLKAHVSLKTAEKPIHSGSGGGYVVNPLNSLTMALAKCCEPATGMLDIQPIVSDRAVLSHPTDEEHAALLKVAEGYNLSKLDADLGAIKTITRDAYTALKQMGFRPTFEIHNYTGGVIGTKIPHEAGADISMRLVEDLSPECAELRLRQHLAGINPDINVQVQTSVPAIKIALDNPFIKKAAAACEQGFGRPPLYVAEGGTIGALVPMQRRFPGVPMVLLSQSLTSDGYHAPNEHFRWRQAEDGMKTVAHYVKSL